MKNNYRKNKLVLMDNIKKIFILLLMSLFINVLLNSTVFAGAASDYGVDYMETFDDLQDWTGSGYGDRIVPAEMPVKSDGSSSMWEYYSNWQNDYSQTWIGNHGTENVWGGTGKSLIIDYAGNKGPSRLGTYIGDGDPTAGYDEVYIFFMVKFPFDFFPKLSGDDTKFEYFSYHKFMQISTGFRDIYDWGTVEQQAATISKSQSRNIYGHNFTLFNFKSYDARGNELKVHNCPRVSNDSADHYVNLDCEQTTAQVSQFINAGEWFAIEYYLNRGTVNKSDGVVKVWIYNKEGVIVSTATLTKQRHLNNFANHRYNKFVIGGNRSFSSGSSHLYIDDFIVNGSRIGPNYFAKKIGKVPLAPLAIRLIKVK